MRVVHCAFILVVMKPLRQLILNNCDSIDALVRQHRGISASIFGSVARGEDTAASDIDFLIQFESGSSLFDLLQLENDLRNLLGRKVDVVSVGGLTERDSHIRFEAVPI
jgi:predicted nucleotidyltransferase